MLIIDMVPFRYIGPAVDPLAVLGAYIAFFSTNGLHF